MKSVASFLPAAFFLFGTAFADPPPVPEDANWRAVEIAASAHALRGRTGEENAVRVGRLIYRGGVELTSSDPGFGGFSGLSISPDGRGLLAISDRGQWLAAAIVYSGDGRLAGLAGARMAALTGEDGGVLSGRDADAEGLAMADGTVLASFERRARVDAYTIGEDGLLHLESRRLDLSDVDALKGNESLESVAYLADGRIVAIDEDRINEADLTVAGWIFGPDGLSTFAYEPGKDFQVADAHAGPDGDFYFLERAYSPLAGVRIRVTLATVDDLGAGRTVTGEELVRLGPLQGIDNFEGLAVRRDILGRTFLYLISDDNFSARQKTLLLMFELADAAE